MLLIEEITKFLERRNSGKGECIEPSEVSGADRKVHRSTDASVALEATTREVKEFNLKLSYYEF